MPETYIDRSIAGVDVPQRSSDGYISATALSNAHEERTGERREPYEWLNSARIRKTLQHLSGSTGIPVDLLVVVIKNGPNKYRGTYIHPRLSTRYAIWLSDDFTRLSPIR